MKKFLKEKGGVDQYPDVTIQWIFHHNPELLIFDESGKQTEKVALDKYDYNGLHELFKRHFRSKAEAAPSGMQPAQVRQLRDDVLRLADRSASPSAATSPDDPLLHDASAPQPEPTGWRLADSLAEIGMTTTAVWLLMTVASLGACALCSWQGRQGPKPGWRAGRAAQNEEDNVCHVA